LQFWLQLKANNKGNFEARPANCYRRNILRDARARQPTANKTTWPTELSESMRAPDKSHIKAQSTAAAVTNWRSSLEITSVVVFHLCCNSKASRKLGFAKWHRSAAVLSSVQEKPDTSNPCRKFVLSRRLQKLIWWQCTDFGLLLVPRRFVCLILLYCLHLQTRCCSRWELIWVWWLDLLVVVSILECVFWRL
jgi:hypothetical protein